jgi:hypothetical protein
MERSKAAGTQVPPVGPGVRPLAALPVAKPFGPMYPIIRLFPIFDGHYSRKFIFTLEISRVLYY